MHSRPLALRRPIESADDRPDGVLLRPETDPDVLEGFLVDAARVRGRAEGLVRPRSEGELARILRHATAAGRPVTPAALHSSLTGASVPDGGWVVDLSLLGPGEEGVRIDPVSRRAVVPARVVLGAFQRMAEARGLLYPPDPTSRFEAAIGATVACNASGARTFRYGPTRAWVRRLRVALANGDVCDVTRGELTAPPGGEFVLLPSAGAAIRIPVPPPFPRGLKSSLGYGVDEERPDLVDLFVGSEGTLGVIVEVEVDLVPLPDVTLAALAFFPSEDAGLSFVERAREGEGGVGVRCLEWFDRGSLDRARGATGRPRIPADARAAVFFEQECVPGGEGDVFAAWWSLLEATSVCPGEDGVQVGDDERGREAFRVFRHAVPAAVNEEVARNGFRKLGTDLAWPRADLRGMMRTYHEVLEDLPAALPDAVRGELEDRFGRVPREVPWVMFGHVGDNHVHVNLLPRDACEAEAARLAYRVLAERAVAAGGTVAGEHGIGKTKRELLRLMVGDEGVARMLAVKRALDPRGILARGNLFPPEVWVG